MAEYNSLGQQPPVDKIDGIRSSTHRSMGSIRSTFAGSNSRSNSQFEQGNAEAHAWESEWTSPADFIESSFRPSIDLSILTTFGWLDRGSYTSKDNQLSSIPYGHERMESADTTLSNRPLLATSRPSAADSFEREDVESYLAYCFSPLLLRDALRRTLRYSAGPVPVLDSSQWTSVSMVDLLMVVANRALVPELRVPITSGHTSLPQVSGILSIQHFGRALSC